MNNESIESITKDDWELTLKELKGQRLQLTLQGTVINAGIAHIEHLIKTLYPKDDKEKMKEL